MAANLRGVVIGASTLLGKELIEELNTSDGPWDVRLADSGDSSGQLVAGGEEPLLIQPLSRDVFDARDIAFFAAEPPTTLNYWREARTAGVGVIDMNAALGAEPGAMVRSPWIPGSPPLSSDTSIVIPAHPASVMLGVVASRLTAAFGSVFLAATVLEPASQQGSGGLDEMHQQTVSLLGFHPLPQNVYDGQVAFNLRIGLGEAAKPDLGAITSTIHRHLKAIVGESIASSVALQLVQAPVFHAYTMSVFVRLSMHQDLTVIRRSLDGSVVHLISAHEEAPSNQSVVEEPGIAIALTEESSTPDAHGFWLWIAADNLKLAARHAIACAEELAALRASKPQ